MLSSTQARSAKNKSDTRPEGLRGTFMLPTLGRTAVQYFHVPMIERHPDAFDAPVADQLVVININSLEYFSFNDVAREIWALLADGPRTEEAICEALLAQYEVSQDECKSAVSEFVEKAIARDFLRRV